MRCWWALLLTSAVLAAEPQTFVVAVGVEKYDDERISSLKFATADARSVAQAFRGAGVPRQNVTLLSSDETDGARRPTRANLLRALQNVRQRAAGGDKLVFYFAGHGIEQEGEHYLLTVDAQVDLVQDMSLPMRLVNKALDGLQASEVLFILDACRNDPQKGRGDADATMTDGLARGLRPQFKPVGTVPKPRVVATLLACDAGERAWEDPEAGHGVFTLYLAKGLSGQAATDGQVTLSGLAAYVQAQVAQWAARSKRVQTPQLLNGDGDMVLLVPPAEPLVSVSFQNSPLAAVVDQLGQQYGVQVVLGKGVNAEAKVTGRLENLPLSTTLRALLAAHALTVRQEGAVYIIEAPAGAVVAAPTVAVPVAPAGPVELPAGWPAYLERWRAQMPALQYRIREKDGMPQVLIPAGEFLMGSTAEEQARALQVALQVHRDAEAGWFSGEGPQQRVRLSAYWLDVQEVTNEQYCRFLNETQPSEAERKAWLSVQGEEKSTYLNPQIDARDGRYEPEWGKGRHPVIWVTWFGAEAYAKWAGAQLPTEAQFERALRGGVDGAEFPWGDSARPPAAYGNYQDATAGRVWDWDVGDEGYDDGQAGTSPVGTFAPNRYGLTDLSGNVCEWCADWYGQTWYAKMPLMDPVNTTPSDHGRVCRGGSWTNYPQWVRAAGRMRDVPECRRGNLGFRCAAPVANVALE